MKEQECRNETSSTLLNGCGIVLLSSLVVACLSRWTRPGENLLFSSGALIGAGIAVLVWALAYRKKPAQAGTRLAILGVFLSGLAAMLLGIALHGEAYLTTFLILFASLVILAAITLMLINKRYAEAYLTVDSKQPNRSLIKDDPVIDLVPFWQPVLVFTLIIVIGATPEILLR